MWCIYCSDPASDYSMPASLLWFCFKHGLEISWQSAEWNHFPHFMMNVIIYLCRNFRWYMSKGPCWGSQQQIAYIIGANWHISVSVNWVIVWSAIACRLFDAKPSSEPNMTYYQLLPSETYANDIWYKRKYSFMKKPLKISFAKWWQFCLGINVLFILLGVDVLLSWLHCSHYCYSSRHFPCGSKAWVVDAAQIAWLYCFVSDGVATKAIVL